MKVLRAVAASVAIAVSVWFFIESQKAVARLAAASEPAVDSASAPTAEQVAARTAALEASAKAAREASEARAAAYYAAAEQSARIKKSLEAVAVAPKPEPKRDSGRWYTPKDQNPLAYTNKDLKPDTAPARIIVDFSPSDANRLDWEEAVRSGRCAAFSFVKAGDTTPTNRLFCDPVVAH